MDGLCANGLEKTVTYIAIDPCIFTFGLGSLFFSLVDDLCTSSITQVQKKPHEEQTKAVMVVFNTANQDHEHKWRTFKHHLSYQDEDGFMEVANRHMFYPIQYSAAQIQKTTSHSHTFASETPLLYHMKQAHQRKKQTPRNFRDSDLFSSYIIMLNIYRGIMNKNEPRHSVLIGPKESCL